MTPARLMSLILLFDTVAVGIAVAISANIGDLTEHFGEGRYISIMSGLYLLAASWMAFQVFGLRRRQEGAVRLRSSFVLWAIIGCGFLYLAADELLEIHEAIDEQLHHWLDLEETALSDRLDDLIVGIYGMIGILVIYAYRREFGRLRPRTSYLSWGFVLLFVMVGLDAFTNRGDILALLVRPSLVSDFQDWISILEDTAKLVAEGCFLVAFYGARLNARALAQPA